MVVGLGVGVSVGTTLVGAGVLPGRVAVGVGGVGVSVGTGVIASVGGAVGTGVATGEGASVDAGPADCPGVGSSCVQAIRKASTATNTAAMAQLRRTFIPSISYGYSPDVVTWSKTSGPSSVWVFIST